MKVNFCCNCICPNELFASVPWTARKFSAPPLASLSQDVEDDLLQEPSEDDLVAEKARDDKSDLELENELEKEIDESEKPLGDDEALDENSLLELKEIVWTYLQLYGFTDGKCMFFD